MFMVPTAWELASLVCKLFLYFGAASIAGGSLCLWLYSDGTRHTVQTNLRYILVGAVLGFQGVLINFLIQVGLVNDSGLAGMFDLSMANLLLDTQLGDVTFSRLIGFVTVLISCLFFMRKVASLTRPPGEAFYHRLVAVHTIALLILAFSFRVSGHLSVAGPVAQVAIVLHLIAAMAWIGALYPLFRLTYCSDLELLRSLMKRFGDNAAYTVLALVVAGALMSFELLPAVGNLVNTVYGQMILLKLALVLGILGIAAANKLIFVPKIIRDSSAAELRLSIRVEIVVATAILLATSYLSTIIGPPAH